MPTFNDAPFLRDAINSVLGQTYPHFEFIIVNDGSTDETGTILSRYNDPRIRVLKHDSNRGNAAARNTALESANGKYVAMMDSDDILAPHRIESQVQYLEEHREIGMVAGFIVFFTPGWWYLQNYPLDNDYIQGLSFYRNIAGQPTVMLRKELLDKNDLKYDPGKENMEDYDFWFRVARVGIKMKCLPEVVLYYRQSESQLSHESNIENRKKMLRAFFRFRLAELKINLTEEEFELFHQFVRTRIPVNKQSFIKINGWLTDVEKANKIAKAYPQKGLAAATLFYRLRLLKFYYWDKKRPINFLFSFLLEALKAGPQSLRLFIRNEARYFGKTGINHLRQEKPPLPVYQDASQPD